MLGAAFLSVLTPLETPMPKCPNCQCSLAEDHPACPSCEFSLLHLDKLMGPPPALTSHASDLTDTLSMSELTRINTKLSRYQKRFPQCRFTVVFVNSPKKVNLPLLTFWGHNRWGLSHVMKKGGDCLLILLVIDIQAKAACVSVGYGLEPWLKDDLLNYWLESIQPHLQEGKWAEASVEFYGLVIENFKELPDYLERTYGLMGSLSGDSDSYPY